MHYWHACFESAIQEIDKTNALAEYCDVWDSSNFLEGVKNGHINEHDPVLMFFIDGVQLYHNKGSDCWIYLWVLLDRSPDLRYKKKYVLLGGFIPSPSKPKNLDSFIFPGMYHLSALQREGMCHWDAIEDAIVDLAPFLVLVTANSPAMAMIFGSIGHHGAYGCHLYCPQKGRHKPGGAQYYPVCLAPLNLDLASSTHLNYDLRTMVVPLAQETEQRYIRVLWCFGLYSM